MFINTNYIINNMPSKSELAIVLSKLKQFDNPKVVLEQYSTDPEIAAQVLWSSYMQGDIEGKTVADLGCGPGVFGIGAALLGAKKVYFVDVDDSALKITKENMGGVGVKGELVLSNVKDFSKKVDTVLMNPPFGTKVKHHDRLFLEKAFSISTIIYSIHKITSKKFISEFATDSGFKVESVEEFKMKLVRTMKHHKKGRVIVDCGVWRIKPIAKN